MGLDMYLHAERYVSSKPLFNPDDPGVFETLLGIYGSEVGEAAKAVQFPSAHVQFTVAYWRKANQIHSWFVRECQDGIDECQKTYVPREKLKELREVCLRLLASDKDEELAGQLLEPQGGFFFGSTDYSDYYWDDLKDTVRQLDRVLALPDQWTIYYRSSW